MIPLICITCFFIGWHIAKRWYKKEVIDPVDEEMLNHKKIKDEQLN